MKKVCRTDFWYENLNEINIIWFTNDNFIQ